MDARVKVFRPIQIGETPLGFQQAIPIGDGSFEGPLLRGTAIAGAADWQLIRRDGVALLDVTGAMLTDDGVTIRVSSKGMRHGPREVMQRLAAGEQVLPTEYYMRAVAKFDAPAGRYEWLNRALFVTWGERYANEVVIHYFAVAMGETANSQPASQLVPPSIFPKAEYVFAITGSIAEPMTMGDTALGTKRAIPITGGSVQGDKIRGRVIPGGADWQLIRRDGVTELEASYALQLDDGAIVQVVNRGIMVPAPQHAGPNAKPVIRTAISFEAPAGPHEWLNKAIFLTTVNLHPELSNAVLVNVYRLA